MRDVLDHGVKVPDGPEYLREIRGYACTLRSVRENDPLLRRFADPERIRLMYRKYGSLGVLPQYKISYGALLYANHGVDQIDWIVHRLLAKRETKSATIVLHSPGEPELSCLSLLDFKIRDDTLHMTAVYRSQNVYASQPGNVLALREIQEQVSAKVDATTGELMLVALSAHVYEADVAAATEIVRAYDELRSTEIVRAYDELRSTEIVRAYDELRSRTGPDPRADARSPRGSHG
jgi:thymidylate synthase